jgi:hypothetical protein
MYEIAKGETILRAKDNHVNWYLVALGMILPPVLCVTGLRLWRYYYPGDVGLRRRTQSKAARQALRELKHLRRDPQGRATVAILTRYLRARVDLIPLEPTPVEINEHLGRVGLSGELTGRMGQFFHVAEMRFAPVQNGALHDSRTEAARLIHAVEEEAQ